MGWKHAAWIALLVACWLEVGLCVNPPHARSARQCFRVRSGQHQRSRRGGHGPAWIGPFDLSEEQKRRWEENVYGPDKTRPPTTTPPPPASSADDETTPLLTSPSSYSAKGFPTRATLVGGVSRRLGGATEGGARALRALAARSTELGREGGAWLQRRWRVKAGWCLVGLYGLRLAGRVVARVKANVLSSGDVVLDAEDRTLARRGAILDTEGQAILLRLRALGSPATASAAAAATTTATTATFNGEEDIEQLVASSSSSNSGSGSGGGNSSGNSSSGNSSSGSSGSAASGEETTGRGDDFDNSCGGWGAVESGVKRAINLRCVGGRGHYAQDLSDALRELEQARDKADMEIIGPQRASLVDQAVLLVQARLCDACLRSLRDGLLRASSDLSALSSFWKDQRSNDRRMGVIKSVVLGTLVHRQVSGKRVAVERDQEKVSTSELLLEGYLRRLGGIQTHLQERPKAPLAATPTATGGAMLTEGAVESLETWVDDGMRMFLQSVEEVEASLEHQAQDKSGRSWRDSEGFGDDFLKGDGGDGGGGNGGGDGDGEMSAIFPHAATVKSVVLFNDDDTDMDIDIDVGGGDSSSRGGGGGGGGSSARKRLLNACSPSSQTVLPFVRGGETAGDVHRGGDSGDSGSLKRHSLSLLRGRTVCPPPSSPLSEPIIAAPGGGGGDNGWGACPAHASIQSLRGGGVSGGVAPASTLFLRGASSESRVVATASTFGNGARDQRTVPTVKVGAGLGGSSSSSAGVFGGGLGGSSVSSAGMFGGGLGGGSGSGSAKGTKSVAGVPAVVLLRARPKSRTAGAGGTAWQETPSSGLLSKERARAQAATNRSAAEEKGGGGGRGARSATIAPSQGAGVKSRSTTKTGGDDVGLVNSAWQRLTRGKAAGRRSHRSAAEQPMPEGWTKTGVPRESRGLGLVSLRRRDDAISRAGATVNGSAKVIGGRREPLRAGASALGTKVSDDNKRRKYLDTVSVLASRALEREADARRKRTDWARRKSSGGAAVGEDAGGEEGSVVATAASANCENVEGLVRDDCADDCRTKEAGGVKVRCVAAAASACDAGKAVATAAATGVVASVKSCASCLAVALSSPTRLARTVVAGGAVDPSAATVVDEEDDVETDHATNGSDGEDGTAQRKNRSPDRSAVITGDVAADHQMDATAAVAMPVQALGDASTAAESTDGECEVAALVPNGEERGAPASRLKIGGGVGGLVRTCAHVCGSLAKGASALCQGSAVTVCNVGGATFRGVLKTAQCCTGCVGMVLSSPVRLVRVGGRAIASASATGGGGAAAGAKRWCRHIFRSAGTGVSTGCAAATTTVCLAGRTAVKSVHTSSRFCVGCVRFAVNRVHASSRFCVGCVGAVLSPPGRLGRAAVLLTGKTVSILGEKGGAFIVRPCTRLGQSGRAAVSSGCLTAMVATFMLREAAVCGAVSSARYCARGIGCVLSSPVKLGRAVVAFPLLLRPRRKNAAVVSATASSSRETAMMGTSPTTVTATEAIAASKAMQTTTTTSAVASKSPPDLVETPGRRFVDNEKKTPLALETCARTAPYAGVESTAGTTVVISNNHSRVVVGAVGASAGNAGSQTPAAWRGGRRRRRNSGAKRRRMGRFGPRALVSSSDATESRGRGSTAAVEERTRTENNEQGLSSSSLSSSSSFAFPAFSFPAFPSLWSRSGSSNKEAFLLGFFRRSPANGTLSFADQDGDGVTAAAAAAAASVPTSGADSSPSKASEAAEAACLARWVETPPSPRVPERSGRRSRALVCGATRVATIAVPNSASAGGGGARGAGLTRAVRTMAAGEAAEAGAARPAPRRRVRAAAGFVVAVPVAKETARYLRSNWTELRGLRAEAAVGLSTFFSEQLWRPCQAIVNQVLFRERSNLMDRAAIDDAETSLQNMLRDFLSDKKNKIPDHIRREAVKTMDMSVVSRQLERETRGALRGTVNGRIPRMLLIQAAFLKKELLHAMEAIDELFQANQVTLRLISVVPAALVILGVVRGSKSFVHAASSRRLEPTTLVHRSMRASVRKMERLLTSSRGFVGDQDLDGELGAASRSLLSNEETGKLAFHLHELQTTLRQNNSRFEARTRRGLEEDLADLTSGNGLTVVQQIAVVRRMQRSYSFLRPAQGV